MSYTQGKYVCMRSKKSSSFLGRASHVSTYMKGGMVTEVRGLHNLWVRWLHHREQRINKRGYSKKGLKGTYLKQVAVVITRVEADPLDVLIKDDTCV
jgi:hypothetical protein